MKIGEYEVHPAAEIFPLLEGQAFEALCADIKTNGLEQMVTLFDGKILDGRNRMRACEIVGVKPDFDEHDGGDPVAFVVSLNLHRRHLNESQRSMVAARIANMGVGDNQHTEGRSIDLTSQDAAAGMLNVSTPSLKRAKKVQQDATPEVSAAVDAGQLPVSQAAQLSDQPEDFQREVVEHVKSGDKPIEAIRKAKRSRLHEVEPLPDGKHRVIYADPPWQYSDSRGLDGYDASAAESHYPTMSVAELSALDVRSLAADDCVLFCWATFPLLPDALEVIKAWGFKYKTSFVWAKQRPNLGNYHNASAELLIVATRGSATPDQAEREDQVQLIQRVGRHSEKPEEFRAMVDRLYTQGRRIELFRRGDAPEGWHVWGNEVSTQTSS